MEKKHMLTCYASAERASEEIIRKQYSIFKDNHLIIKILDAISTADLILNKHRQLVFANSAFLNFSGDIDIKAVLGLRVGEALGCINSELMEGGCGTSENCRECGAVKAILTSYEGEEEVQECRIPLKENNQVLDLRVRATPITHYDEEFTVFSITDIADEKRKEDLERDLLHNVKKRVEELKGFCDLGINLAEDSKDATRLKIRNLTDKLADEIDSYSQLKQQKPSS